MLPTYITLQDIKSSPTLETCLRKKADKLSTYCQRILCCRILISLLQKRQRQGKLYRVRVELSMPGKQLTANHVPDENIHIAIRDTFAALKRQLEHYTKKRHHHASKQHHHALLLTNEPGQKRD